MREFLCKHNEEEHPMISWDIRPLVSWNKGKKERKKKSGGRLSGVNTYKHNYPCRAHVGPKITN